MVVSIPPGTLVFVAVGWFGTLFLVWSLLYAGRQRERVSEQSRRRH